jgi:hypothetical protein
MPLAPELIYISIYIYIPVLRIMPLAPELIYTSIYYIYIYIYLYIYIHTHTHTHIIHIGLPNSSPTPRVFYTYFYNHARRLRFEKLLYLEVFRSSNGYFKPLLDPGGGFRSETAVT